MAPTSLSVRSILQSSTAWLTDSITYAAQLLLKRQGDQLHVLHPQNSKREKLFNPLPPNSKFIQFYNTYDSHWILISNINGGKCTRDSVRVYDSAFETVCLFVKKAVCSIMKPQSGTIKFDLVNV